MALWNNELGKTFIVAEIGQNHQGSLHTAKQMIKAAKDCGADCVKFQRSNLSEKFTASALARPYTGPNSWGSTYGEHKQWLEFSIDQYRELQAFAAENDIAFTASAMDGASYRELEEQLSVPFIKIGSGDADNVPILRYAANRSTPLIISTGMLDWDQICTIHMMFRHRKDVALLHCVSSYPTRAEDSMLQMIPLFRSHFPELTIGYSGHELGIQLTVASVVLGAQVVERHFTLDKSWKGTDHKASLNPAELTRMVRCIRVVEKKPGNKDIWTVIEQTRSVLEEDDFNESELLVALKEVSTNNRKLLECERSCHDKLGKSLVYANDVRCGAILSETDIQIKVSEPKGLAPRWYDSVVGKMVKQPVLKDNPVLEQHF
ncbi:sialic acid synthase [Anopheles maculipalpis]|uniref:sialic acid synthase n=1 Tax=Anopheles maculipalpis TaxID=1496333 RepID=UPI002159585C|nr:sialic acid synthase [Anopheles maculipalpis]